MKIKEIIVVEGKEDTRRLKEVFPDIDTIETRGSAIDDRTIELIRNACANRGVIVFTDPDYQGERIRKIINEQVPGCKNAYIKKAKAIDEHRNKVGVEHCRKEDLIESLSFITVLNEEESDLEYTDLLDLEIIGCKNSQEIREYLSDVLHLGYNNAKQFYKKIKMFNISKATLIKLINDYKKSNGEDE